MKPTRLFLALIALITACSGADPIDSPAPDPSPADQTTPHFLQAPRLTLAPNEDTPLAASLEALTDEPASIEVEVSDGQRTWSIPASSLAVSHRLTLLGFSPGKSHQIRVRARDEAGNLGEWPEALEAVTEPLPVGFPTFTVQSDPERMEPGITLFRIRGREAQASFGTYILAVDEVGRIVWLHRGDATDVKKSSDGNLLILGGGSIRKIDFLGNVLQEWGTESDPGGPGAIPIANRGFHHEVLEMSDGNLVALGLEARAFSDYPSSASDPAAPTETANVVGDVVVEFTPGGEIVRQHRLLDMIDPYRINYSSLGGIYNAQFPELAGGTRDWSHGNAVVYDAEDDSFLVSMRHQDAVVKFRRSTGELIWILGPHENWDSAAFGSYLLAPLNQQPGFFWPYHQHAPMILPNRNILLFDNGNFRASPFDAKLPDEENYSRAVEYRIDESAMTIEKIWEYGEEEGIYADFVGDADYLPQTGNVLIAFGGIKTPEGYRARLIEVNRSGAPEKVFDLSLNEPHFFVYRALRYPSL
ncbi:MAG TPA: aryl-sulfate sulfotransferase [bacterium]|nr:aryl-sulfate sulfotransferase [bacterium]